MFIFCSDSSYSVHQEYLPYFLFFFLLSLFFRFEGFFFVFCLIALSSLRYMSSPTRPCQWKPMILITSHQGTNSPLSTCSPCFSFSEPQNFPESYLILSAGSFQCFHLIPASSLFLVLRWHWPLSTLQFQNVGILSIHNTQELNQGVDPELMVPNGVMHIIRNRHRLVDGSGFWQAGVCIFKCTLRKLNICSLTGQRMKI